MGDLPPMMSLSFLGNPYKQEAMKQEAMSPIISPRSPDATTDLKEAKSPEFTRNLKEATSPNSTPIFGADWSRGFSSTSNAQGNNVMPHASSYTSPQPNHDPFWDQNCNTIKIPHVVQAPPLQPLGDLTPHISKTQLSNPNCESPETVENTLPLTTRRSDAGHDSHWPTKKKKTKSKPSGEQIHQFFIVVLLIRASL